MLIKVTNKCGMGCSHCMEESTPKGEHMTWETFLKALDMTRRVEGLVWSQGYPPFILLSGGECSEHPEIVRMVEEVVRQEMHPLLITNGMWLGNPELRDALLRPEWTTLRVQVTNDPRFYPTAPPTFEDERIVFVPTLTALVPLGRAARKKNIDAKGVPEKNAPTSFNLRSLARSYRSIEQAVAVIRLKTLMGSSGFCIPSVCDNGDVVAGETRLCWKIGTVDSTNDELTRGLLDMGVCNRCGLEDNLTQPQKRAIGITTLFLGSE